MEKIKEYIKNNKYEIIISAVVFVIGTILTFMRWPNADEVLYLKETMVMTEQLKNFNWFGNDKVGSHGFIFKLPVALFYILTGPNIWIANIFNVIIASLSTFLFYKVTKFFTSDKELSLIITSILVLSYYFVKITPLYLRDIPVMFSLLLFFLAIAEKRSFLALGFILLLVFDAKEYIAVIMTPPLILWILINKYKKNGLNFKFFYQSINNGLQLFVPSLVWVFLMFWTPIVPVNSAVAGIFKLTEIGATQLTSLQTEKQLRGVGTDTNKLIMPFVTEKNEEFKQRAKKNEELKRLKLNQIKEQRKIIAKKNIKKKSINEDNITLNKVVIDQKDKSKSKPLSAKNVIEEITTKPESKETIKLASKDTTKPESKETIKLASKDTTKPESKETTKLASKDTTKPESKETTKLASKDTTKPASKEKTKLASKDAKSNYQNKINPNLNKQIIKTKVEEEKLSHNSIEIENAQNKVLNKKDLNDKKNVNSETIEKRKNIWETITEKTATPLNFIIVYSQKILSPRTFSYMSFPLFLVVLSFIYFSLNFKQSMNDPIKLFFFLFYFVYLIIYILRPSHSRYLIHLGPLITIFSILFLYENYGKNFRLIISILIASIVTLFSLYYEIKLPFIKAIAHLFFISQFVLLVFFSLKNNQMMFKRILIIFGLTLSLFGLSSSIYHSISEGEIKRYLAFGYANEYQIIAKYFDKNKTYWFNGDSKMVQFYNSDKNQGVQLWDIGKSRNPLLKAWLPKSKSYNDFIVAPNFYQYSTPTYNNNFEYMIDYVALIISQKKDVEIFDDQDRISKYIAENKKFFILDKQIELQNKKLIIYRFIR